MADHSWDFHCAVCVAALDDCLYGGHVCDGCGSEHAKLYDEEEGRWCRKCKAECEICLLVIPAGGKLCSECHATIEASEIMAPMRRFRLPSLGVA